MTLQEMYMTIRWRLCYGGARTRFPNLCDAEAAEQKDSYTLMFKRPTDAEESSRTFFDKLPPRQEVARRAIHAITPHGPRTFLDVCIGHFRELGDS